MELSEKIKNIPFDILYVSPFLRTRHTAEIINKNNVKTIIDDRLRERDCGNLSGQPYGKNEEREDYWCYFSNKEHGTAENIKPFFARVYNFINELKNIDYKIVLIVAHSGVSKAFSGYFEGVQDGKLLNRDLKTVK